jgi:hypothetical protein
MKKIAQIFVAFSEKQNFTIPCPLQYCSNPPHIFRHSYGLVVVFEDNVEIGIVLLNRKKRYKFWRWDRATSRKKNREKYLQIIQPDH